MPGKGAFKRCVAKVAAKGGAVDPAAVCAAAGRKKYGPKRFAAMAKAGRKRVAAKRKRGNPITEATDRYQDFHGEPPKETYAFEEAWHYHGVTAQVGVLVSLKIMVPKMRGGGVVTVKGFKDARLTMNEAGTQLYVEGGDQALDLAAFGIKEPHEREYLGECVEVTYHTVKKHLGKEGGDANYVHRFGHIEGGDKTERPKMIYDVLNEEIIFAGGGYTIPSEGIDG